MSNYRTIYITDNGAAKTGLFPIWTMLKSVGTINQTQPTIEEIGGGWYRFIANLNPFEHWVGVVDAGSSVSSDSERYIPIDLRFSDFDGSEDKEIYVTPIYDADSDTLTLLAFLAINGKILNDNSLLTSISIGVYNHAHSLLFTLSTSSFTNGVAVMSQSAPALIANVGHYLLVTLTTTNEVITANESFVSMQ